MYCFSIFECHDSEISTAIFFYFTPKPNSSIWLNFFSVGILYHIHTHFNSQIRTFSHNFISEICCCLHAASTSFSSSKIISNPITYNLYSFKFSVLQHLFVTCNNNIYPPINSTLYCNIFKYIYLSEEFTILEMSAIKRAVLLRNSLSLLNFEARVDSCTTELKVFPSSPRSPPLWYEFIIPLFKIYYNFKFL